MMAGMLVAEATHKAKHDHAHEDSQPPRPEEVRQPYFAAMTAPAPLQAIDHTQIPGGVTGVGTSGFF